MKPLLFSPDRLKSNPLARTYFCPVGATMQEEPYRLPDFQQRYLEATTKRDRGRVMAEFALKFGLGSDNSDLWHQIQADWIEPSEKAN
jgi:hypothetical protein